MKKSPHVQRLTLRLNDSRNATDRERERIRTVTIEQINAPYPWPDQLLIQVRGVPKPVLFLITGALAHAAVWTAQSGEQILATREEK